MVAYAFASYLPGTKPKTYKEGARINLYVDQLDSSITQLPFSYNYLNFCKSQSNPSSESTMQNSAYEIRMQQQISCQHLCQVNNTADQLESFTWMIENEYRATWLLDTLPSGYRISVQTSGKNIDFYQYGVPIGFTYNGKKYIYNHHHIIIKTFDNLDGTFRVVGFLVQPLNFNTRNKSVCELYDWEDIIRVQSLNSEEIMTLDSSFRYVQMVNSENYAEEVGRTIDFTYSVSFEPSNVKWTSRWDVYLYSQQSNVHWISILNSFFIVVLLTGMVGHLLRGIVSRDIYNYNERVEINEERESGWKQLKGDVFRPPEHPMAFSVLLGTGVQLISMGLITLTGACIGILNPDQRGVLFISILFFFAFMGYVGGYFSSRVFKMFGGSSWKTTALLTALAFPSFCFLVFFLINFLIWEEESSGAVDFNELLELLCIWFGISLPLVFIGSARGFRNENIENPFNPLKVPRPILQKDFKWLQVIIALSGSLPFGCMFIELNSVMKSLWNHSMFHYLFGFLFMCFIVLIITSAEVSILLTYILLCKENYKWWWFSFTASGSSGVYLFVYSALYYMFYLSINRFSSTVLYFGYMLIVSVVYGLITGTVGAISSFIFIRRIYSLVKSE